MDTTHAGVYGKFTFDRMNAGWWNALFRRILLRKKEAWSSMSDSETPDQGPADPGQPQQVRTQHVSARVPDAVSRGVLQPEMHQLEVKALGQVARGHGWWCHHGNRYFPSRHGRPTACTGAKRRCRPAVGSQGGLENRLDHKRVLEWEPAE